MPYVACALGGGELVEQRADAVPDGMNGALVGLAQQSFELGEELLDRVEVWAVGRQEEPVGAGVSDCATHALPFVAAKIVEHDDVADVECRDEELDHPGEEDGSIDRTIDDAGCDDAVGAQPSQERHRGPAAVWDMADQALAARRPTVRTGHVGFGPGLIDKDQALRINASLIAPPTGALASDVWPLLLGGAQSFF